MSGIVEYNVVFQTQEFPAGLGIPSRLIVTEGLSERTVCEIDFSYHGSTPLEVRAFLRKAADVLVFRTDTGEMVRRFAGLVTRARERVTRTAERQLISLTIEDLLHPLALSSDYRITLDKTTKDIVASTLEGAGVSASAVEWRLSGSYQKREACAQWGERSRSFVERLLEDDGIYYFFIHGSDPKVVFADNSTGYEPIPGDTSVAYVPEAQKRDDGIISVLRQTGRVRPAKVTLLDRDFKKPSLDLTAEQSGDAPLGRELYEYPAGYVDPAEGKRRAKARLDEVDSDSVFVSGVGRVFRMTAGHTFTIAEGPSWSDGPEWVARRVRHEWSRVRELTEYQTTFDLLKTDQTFRPPRRAPRPKVFGPQTAIVCGPAGEEIYCDEHGRVKVQFTWDRYGKQDDKSSGWVRVGQMQTSGSVVIPRIGWEVLVEFEDGNPDNPIIIGRVYNGAAMPPQALPGAKTSSSLQSMSTPGGGGHNEISMNDGGGGEVISVHAQKDLNLVVANNKEEKITNNSTVGVGSNHSLKVGASQTVKVGANDSLTVGGSQKHSVGASRTKTISGNESLDVQGARSQTIGASHTTMTPKSVECTTAGSFTETVGASCMEVAALGVSWAVAGSASITVGAAKVEAVATSKSDTTVGARASTIGGAALNLAGGDSSTNTSGSRATTVGGAYLVAAGGDAQFSSAASIKINVGGAVIMNGATIVLKVGGSTVSMSAGAVVLDSSEVKLTATGPNAELAPMVGSK